MSLTEQEIVRRENLEKIIEAGMNPYPAEEYKIDSYAASLTTNPPEPDQTVKLAGRLMSKRIMGKASFAELKDSTGRIQIYVQRDDIAPGEDKMLYNDFFKKWLDIGDFIGVEGFVFRTKVGEITVHVKNITLLSKSLRPLPIVKTDAEGNVHDAFSDPELRYRQRYVDLVVNEEVKSVFEKRSKMITSMRNYFDKMGYMEVDTPVLQPIPGGANARPFVTHHNTLDIPMYLRIANELYLKRLIVGGYDGVYEFSRNFRNEGMDRTHNPEFTVMEIYVAYKDYHWMMAFTENMLEEVAKKVCGTTNIHAWGNDIQFKAPFQRIRFLDAIKQHTGIDVENKTEQELKAICQKLNIEVDETMGRAKLLDEIFSASCEKQLIQPTFIMDYPVEMSPLCKKHRENPGLTERFELFVNGKEIANAYSELNDPIDQRQRFEEQLKEQERGDEEAMYIDHDFLRAIEYGMPPTSGMGIGIDRLAMLLTDRKSIQEVLFFPQMKPEAVQHSPQEDDLLLIPDAWKQHVKDAGFISIEKIKELKPTQLHQKLNGYRKKNKLDIPALQLEEVQQWYQ